MKNDSKSISANEINKFAYCPYQWYYERLYGAAHIRELYKKRNQQLGLSDVALSNFRKGQSFHADYEGIPAAGGFFFKLFKLAAIIIIVIAGIVGGYLFYLHFL